LTTTQSIVTDKPVIPLIQSESESAAVRIATALAAAGMPLVEVVQRTDASLDALTAIVAALPELVVGAGTVLSADQAEFCIERGARFIVSPGLDDGVVAASRAAGVEVFPGIMTPTELQRAHNLGLTTVKFFPASTAGGTAALNGLASVFRQMRFIPTGGISAANLPDYLALDAVLACGGSWMTPPDAIAAGDYDRVTALAREALAIAARARADASGTTGPAQQPRQSGPASGSGPGHEAAQ
jgi:2-dehydro-3-deoxyphosphogluconate aldolase/(4S)-4-hydroxy-2-oxoglutarate aldolase